MSGETPAMNSVSRVISSRELLKPGNEQRHDLDPEVHRVQPADRVEDRLQPPAELTVVPVVEALEIDLVEIDPRPQILEHCRRAVAVRHEAGRQSRRLRFLEHGHRPFARDERLVVGADDHPGVLSQGVAHEILGRGRERRCDRRRGREAPAR